MKLNQLQNMVAIVDHGSLRAAARELDTPQAALSKSVRALERELGVVLFDRESRGMSLTALGRLFHQRASSIVNELRRAGDELAQAQGADEGHLTAGLSIVPHVSMLPQALPQFRRRYPRVKLQLVEGLFPELEARLRDGTLDFYLGAAPHASAVPGLLTTVLFENTRTVIARKGHPLAATRSLEDLQDADWATTAVDYKAEEDLQAVFKSHGLKSPSVVLQAQSALSMIVALTSSDLLALLPLQWAEFPLTRDGLTSFRLQEHLPAPPIVMVRRPDLPLTPAAAYFCDVMERYAPRPVCECTSVERGR
ncbi:MAG TPA: LysR substrate-binding domain-containing protein [Povalibacter sp.]|uniref:LysR substrate-binding domain-containing protein n=1 Tax=Povalibacter sp. TaxID=1962978 RepID=UPI002CC03296|nr:LysR substrate-binding domain-containing protein [Povalibacter sp.]HMN43793.1 LysR substrate-binding domain-containing protein [Povalibacter sp.]